MPSASRAASSPTDADVIAKVAGSVREPRVRAADAAG
jgi:hypothetical protein